jgi:hypothetical protein
MLDYELALAEKSVAEARSNVSRQRIIVERMEREKHDCAAARRLLAQFEEMKALCTAGRDRLLARLAGARDAFIRRPAWD